jgi:hypothetical protein
MRNFVDNKLSSAKLIAYDRFAGLRGPLMAAVCPFSER